MGHRSYTDNWRVKVEPDAGWLAPTDEEKLSKHMRDLCNELAKDIRRHCDGVRNVVVNADTTLLCEYCGRVWTEGKASPHNGGCCDKDIEAMPEESEATT